MEDHHVDRPEVEAAQAVELTGTNRSNPLDPDVVKQHRSPPACSGKRHNPDPPLTRGADRRVSAMPPPALRRPKDASNTPAHHQFPPPRRRQFRTTPIPGGRDLWARDLAIEPIGRVGGLRAPGGHSEGINTRSHPELGRENPQRRWYCVSRRGRAGRRQALAAPTPTRGPDPRAETSRPAAPGPRTPAGWNRPLPPGQAGAGLRAHNWPETWRVRRAVRRTPTPGPRLKPGMIRGPTHLLSAGWSSPVARQAHNLKVVGSNPTPATISPFPISQLERASDVRARCPFLMSGRCPKNTRRRLSGLVGR